MGLKAPGDYSDQFWSNKMSVLLCEVPKPNIFMISGFLNPWSPLFMEVNIQKILQTNKKHMDAFLKILFVNMGIYNSENIGQCMHRSF